MRTLLRSKRVVLLLSVGLLLFLSATAATAWISATGEPRLELRVSHFEVKGPFKMAVVKIRNAGSVAAVYTGVKKGDPDCDLQQRSEAGEWQSRIFKCGTGLTRHLLMPGEEMTGRVHVQSEDEWRIGVAHRRAGLTDRVPMQLQHLAKRISPGVAPWQTAWSEAMEGWESDD